jgi:hypothetical protein
MTRAWHQQFKRAAPKERTVDGIVFDSASEARRYAALKLMERLGEIRDLDVQPAYPLMLPDGTHVELTGKKGRRTKCRYTADFRYVMVSTGLVVIEEHKGHDDDCGRLRRAVFEAIYKVKVLVTSRPRAAKRNKANTSLGGVA